MTIQGETAGPPIPVFNEQMGGALIDAARISVMAATREFPAVGPSILLPGDEELPPTISDCLMQAMQWLDAARAGAAELSPPTSFHVVSSEGRPREA